jgi:hypothetical protein
LSAKRVGQFLLSFTKLALLIILGG